MSSKPSLKADLASAMRNPPRRGLQLRKDHITTIQTSDLRPQTSDLRLGVHRSVGLRSESGDLRVEAKPGEAELLCCQVLVHKQLHIDDLAPLQNRLQARKHERGLVGQLQSGRAGANVVPPLGVHPRAEAIEDPAGGG